MKILILIFTIFHNIRSEFTGCPMDGCESTLNSYVDINIKGFDQNIYWQRKDLLTNSTRGCVSNGMFSLLCAVDIGYVSINVTNGYLLWSIAIDREDRTFIASLPIVNYQGLSIIANKTRCTLINPLGGIMGTFNYNPKLIPPLAGPFVTNGGQIVVADLLSFVGIETSGIPLGVQALTAGFIRLSRSMSLDRQVDRWYLIAQRNNTSSQAIIAAETTGSIVGRLRIVWIYEYGVQLNSCNGLEGPLLSIDHKWLFVVNNTNILVIEDQGKSATIKYVVNLSEVLCATDMAFSAIDSTLLIFERQTYNIIVFNVSTKYSYYMSLTDICQEQVTGQLSRMTIIQNSRMIILVTTAERKAILLLIDYIRHELVSRIDLGYVSEIIANETLSQLAYTKIDDRQMFVTIAHRVIGVMTVRLVISD